MFTITKFAMLATAVALAATSTVQAAEGKSLSGRWISPDNSILTIRGSDWATSRGTGTIYRKAGNTFRVEYHEYQGTACTYRVNMAAGGDILVLETADRTQSIEFCPSGRFTRSD